jgi:hypothetical protein
LFAFSNWLLLEDNIIYHASNEGKRIVHVFHRSLITLAVRCGPTKVNFTIGPNAFPSVLFAINTGSKTPILFVYQVTYATFLPAAIDVFRSVTCRLAGVLGMIVLLSIFPQAASSTIVNYKPTFTFVRR